MALGDVVDQFLNQNRLADTCTAEKTDLAALGIRRQKIDDLDAGDENRRLGRLIDEFRCRGMDGRSLGCRHRAPLVDRLSDHIEDAPERCRPHGDPDLRTGIDDFLAADAAVGRIHGNGAHHVFAEMLGDFQHQKPALDTGFER
jgi:peptide chain release factor 1